jgi:hypothetical protein
LGYANVVDNLPLDRISVHLSKLRDVKTKRGFRVMHWRQIIRLAQDEHDREMAELNAIKDVFSDPVITESAGGIVG